MKKRIISFTMAVFITSISMAQQDGNQRLNNTVTKLDKAVSAKQYEQLANEFAQLASTDQKNWLSWYYAAFCNAKVGWLLQQDPDNIEPYALQAEKQIATARDLLDTNSQKKEMSEVYCVLSMLNRAKVFINPSTYGRKFGPKSSQYTKLALAANPENPRAVYLDGWEKFATPKAWGGDKEKAKILLEKSRQLLTKQANQDAGPHWGITEVEQLLSQLK